MGLATSLFRWVHGSRMRGLAGIPGPAPIFPFGTVLDLTRPSSSLPWLACARYAREYGGLTLIWVAGKPALVLNDPKLIGEVLDSRASDFYKDSPRRALRPILTDLEPFIENGEEWAAHRAGHPFFMKHLDDWLTAQVVPVRAAIRAGLRPLLDRTGSSTVDLTAAIQRLSFDAFAAAALGRAPGDDAYRWFLRMARTGDRRMKLDLALPVLPPPAPGFYAARRAWYGLFDRLIAEAKGDPPAPPRPDLLHTCVRAGFDVSTPAFRTAMANIFYGGVFSVASVLATSLYLLARDPAAEGRLRDELKGLAARGAEPDRAALEGCAYLDAVLRESMRYYPPVPLYFRNVVPDRSIEFAGHTIPADTLLFVTNWYLHRESPHWGNPETFDPGRWLDGGAGRDPLGGDYFFPFGRGPRTCLGMPFALFFLKLALATILTDSRVELDRSVDYVQDFFFGVMMPRGLEARFRPGMN
jgi:cytochrome P450